MTIATNSMKEDLAVAYGTSALYVSAHTADPGTTGASEVSGGSPAYARKALTWTAGSTDGVNTTAAVDIDIPASTTVTHVGIWTAATGGTYKDKATASATFSTQGVLRVTLTYTQS